MATIYEVSELAGVSLATVSRVMNNSGRVSDKTKQKVLDAVATLGYRPNSFAQSLASNRSNSVGILISELHGPFYGQLMAGIEAELRVAHKHVIIAAGHSEEAEEKEGIEFLIGRNCDALILHVEAVSDDYLVELCQGTTPIILLNRHIEAVSDHCITLNNELGGYIAAKAVLEQGHRELGYISGPLWKTDASDRLAGHKRALAEYDLRFNSELFFEGDFQETGGSNGMAHLLASGQIHTAVVCANDEMASGAMDLIRSHNLSVPDDISVVGFDNVAFARYLYPKLSTIDYPVNAMGHMAAQWVMKNVYQDKKFVLRNLFTPKYIARDSIKNLTLVSK
jgi:LacI family transcriptional regulator, galactose operon repressor